MGQRKQEVEAEATLKLAARVERREREQRRQAVAAELKARADASDAASPSGTSADQHGEDRLPDSVVAALAERARYVQQDFHFASV